MAASTSLLIFLGFYMNYSTTRRLTVVPYLGIENWCKNNAKTAKIVGMLLFAIGLGFTIVSYGLGVGSILFFVLWMTIASLVVLLGPLGLIRYYTIIPIILLCCLIELLFS